MRLHRTTLFVAAAVIAVVTVVGLILELPIWGFGLTVVILLALLSLWAARQAPAPVPEPEVVSTEVEPRVLQPSTHDLRGLYLPSATKGEAFVLSGQVNWIELQPDWTDAQLCRFALDSVRARAAVAVRHYSVQDLDTARSEVELQLTIEQADDHGRVRAWISEFQLTLAPATKQHLELVTMLHHREELEELARQAERRSHGYLRNEILATTGSGLVWWLNKHPDELDRAVELIDTFARLSNAANDRPELEPVTPQIPGDFDLGSFGRDEVARTSDSGSGNDATASAAGDFGAAVETVLDGHTDEERQLKAHAWAALEERFGRVDRAEQIRRNYDAEPAERLNPLQSDTTDDPIQPPEPTTPASPNGHRTQPPTDGDSKPTSLFWPAEPINAEGEETAEPLPGQPAESGQGYRERFDL